MAGHNLVSIELPSDDEGLQLPDDDGYGDDWPRLPSDDDGPGDQAEDAPPKSTKRRRHRYIPGPTRKDLIDMICMIPARIESLWFALPPRCLQGAPQDDVMEVYSPPRVVAECREKLGLRGDLSADLETGWDFTKFEHRLSDVPWIQLESLDTKKT